MASMIRSGNVVATIYQRPFEQGQIAFNALHRVIVEGVCPPPFIKLAPEIILKSNLEFFMQKLPLAAASKGVTSLEIQPPTDLISGALNSDF